MELQVTAESALNEAQETKGHEFAVLELSARKYAIEMAMAARELTIKNAVASEKNGDSKPMFGNADLRKAEESVRIGTDKDSQQLRSDLTEVNREIGEHQIEAKYHARNLRILCAFAGNASGDELSPWEEE